MGLVMRRLAPVAGTMVVVLATMPLLEAGAHALAPPLPAPAYLAERNHREGPDDDDALFPDDPHCWEPDTITGRIQECDDAAGAKTPGRGSAPPQRVRADGKAGLLTLAAIGGALAVSGAACWMTARLTSQPPPEPAKREDDDEGAAATA
ncbi:hypothetical protein BKM31_10260 [[Actinomadura] parvosata subsp. kistnae]|uniref:Uncharacterized protein n=1 Tax=[Actinomadura] parvosata subsp. kistnae TaxID=1909395 RepID=A0A1U9ZV16_9ACTN|nr:hypothetical protein [Nonomuraea sp. ATCC 55076]AQZ61803.1 hypothetical protein BKM31_10260 [Nonomuraea sp. ATCC 55076]